MSQEQKSTYYKVVDFGKARESGILPHTSLGFDGQRKSRNTGGFKTTSNYQKKLVQTQDRFQQLENQKASRAVSQVRSQRSKLNQTESSFKIGKHLLNEDQIQKNIQEIESKILGKRVVLKNVKQRLQMRKNTLIMRDSDSSDDNKEFDYNSIIIKNDHGKVLDLRLLPTSYLIQKQKEMQEKQAAKKGQNVIMPVVKSKLKQKVEQTIEVLKSSQSDELQPMRQKYLTLTQTKPHNFEIVDKIYKNELEDINEKLKQQQIKKLRILNKTIQSRIQKGTEINNTRMLEEDQNSEKERKQKAMERIEYNQDRVEDEFYKQQKEKETQSIIQVTDKVFSLDPSKSQKEIYRGRYQLKISPKMPFDLQIQKFAGENIAFYLHKKRDFLMRLQKHAQGNQSLEEQQLIFQRLLKQFAEEEKQSALANQINEKKNYQEMQQIAKSKDTGVNLPPISQENKQMNLKEENDNNNFFNKLMEQKKSIENKQKLDEVKIEEPAKKKPKKKKEKPVEVLMGKEDIKELLSKTIEKMRKHSNKEKQLEYQQFQIKMHQKMQKTYHITRQSKSNKYIKMYNNEREDSLIEDQFRASSISPSQMKQTTNQFFNNLRENMSSQQSVKKFPQQTIQKLGMTQNSFQLTNSQFKLDIHEYKGINPKETKQNNKDIMRQNMSKTKSVMSMKNIDVARKNLMFNKIVINQKQSQSQTKLRKIEIAEQPETMMESQENAKFSEENLQTLSLLTNLINDCENLQKHTIQNLNKFEVDRQNQQILNQKLDQSIDMLKELDTIDSNMIQTIYEYNKQNLEVLKGTMKSVAQQHRSGYMESGSSQIAKIYRGKQKKK